MRRHDSGNIDIRSGFDAVATLSDEIDFSNAVRLKSQGSVCETFLVSSESHRLFVKRLKENLRGSSIHQTALQKEYEVGRILNHPSFPAYRAKGRDYIALDYIEGDTLSQLMERDDPWLRKPANVYAIIRQLVEAIGYLHRNNIVHCDLKPDNIIITRGTRNVVVVDLDKCYTDWFNSTSGKPGNYGVSDLRKGSPSIDFHALAMIAESLSKRRLKNFIRLCRSEDATPATLEAHLEKELRVNRSQRAYRLLQVFALIVFVILVVLFVKEMSSEKKEVEAPEVIGLGQSDEKEGLGEEVAEVSQIPDTPQNKRDRTVIMEPTQAEPSQMGKESGTARPSVAKENKASEADEKAEKQPIQRSSGDELEDVIISCFSNLGGYLYAVDPTDTKSHVYSPEILRKIKENIDFQFNSSRKIACNKLKRKFPSMSDKEIEDAISSSAYYNLIIKTIDKFEAEINRQTAESQD